MIEIFSYGGGRQGIAICALIVQGKLPRPDAIVIADTGREKSSTWRYLEDVTGPVMRDIGLPIQVAPHSLATVDLHSHKGDLLIPAFTAGGGKLQTFCSDKWKRRVVTKWYRHNYGNTPARCWIGFATDELHRAALRESAGWKIWYPLIEHARMSTNECYATIERMGWPKPPRSSCWMCPHMSDQEWRELPSSERRAAEALEAKERQTDPGVYLHRSRRPLGEVDFEGQPDLFESYCKTGTCFT